MARSPAELAQQFSLSESFVRSVLEGTKIPGKPKRKGFSLRAKFKAFAKSWESMIDGLGIRLGIACAVVIALWAASMVGIQVAFPNVSSSKSLFTSSNSGTAITISSKPASKQSPTDQAAERKMTYLLAAHGLTVVVLLALFYLSGKSRYAVYSGLAIYLLIVVGYLPAVVMNAKDAPFGTVGMFFMTAFVSLLLVALIVGLGSLAAVAGGYMQMRQAVRERSNLSRHELLSYYFSIEQRLKAAVATYFPTPPNRFLTSLERYAPWYAAASGFVLTSITILAVKFGNVVAATTPPIWFLVFGLFTSFITMLSFVGLSFLAGGPIRSMLTAIAWTLGSGLLEMVPFFRVRSTSFSELLLQHGISIVAYGIIGFIIGVGAMVQKQAKRDRLLARNDPATLMSELLEIQFALSAGETMVCVLVVDASKSSVMKASADPLVVEYSFRAYQAWLSRIVQAHGGRVYTITGDGAIAAFATCGEALQAGEAIQTDVDRFNREENRLSSPFRLRVGLHAGNVVADLEKVEFTEVIDIAAHVEGASPIGCVGLTDVVAAQLAGYHFDPLTAKVDGHQVYLSRGQTQR